MTTLEINRDARRLLKAYKNARKYQRDGRITSDRYFKIIEEVIKIEWYRLYRADRELKFLNADSIRTLLRLNLKFRFVPLHVFGSMIEIEE